MMKWSKVVLSIMIGGTSLQSTAYAMAHNLRGGMRSLRILASTTKLVAPDAQFDARFGRSVAIDGDTIAVGAPWADDQRGSVYVVSRSGAGVWGVPQKIDAPADVDDFAEFGESVAVSANYLVIGAPNDNEDDGARKGSVYIVNRNGGAWDLLQRLVVVSDGRDYVYDRFGHSVAISGDNLVVGANWVDEGVGAAYVFHLSGNTWVEQQKLVVNDRKCCEEFGWSVAIDGDTIVVGSVHDDANGVANTGSAYVFHFNSSKGSWETKQKLAAPDEADVDVERFGHSVAISGDYLVVGSPRNPSDDIHSDSLWKGAAYVFRRTGDTWGSPQKILAPDAAAYDQFGFSVAIEDGTIVVGSRGDDDESGSAYIFKLVGNTWEFVQKLVSLDRDKRDEWMRKERAWFGISVAISGDTVVVGASKSDDDANGLGRSGSAWVTEATTFSLNPPSATPPPTAFPKKDMGMGFEPNNQSGAPSSGTMMESSVVVATFVGVVAGVVALM